jgi:hypothetical protein
MTCTLLYDTMASDLYDNTQLNVYTMPYKLHKRTK